MHFDPAIAAQQALHCAEENGELATFQNAVVEAEETFSTEAGSVAREAYEKLQQIGERLPQALRFQEFLIYITWQQVTEETIPQHFQKGLELCDRFSRTFRERYDGDRYGSTHYRHSKVLSGGIGDR